MGYVMISADFPGVENQERNEIYKRLEVKGWKKVKGTEWDVSTTWYASFRSTVFESEAITASIDEFKKCAQPYCVPRLVLHFGTTKPVVFGLR